MRHGLLPAAATSVLALAWGTQSHAQNALTLWHNGSCPPDSCIVGALVDAFEAANPDTQIDIVEQPTDSYFTSLLAASVTGTGPDLATMWPGGYMTAYKPYMEDIKQFVPEEHITSSIGTDYFSEGNDNANATYAAPTENQWYIGYYNKEIFDANGITEVPRTWEELRTACETLKANGVTPIISGPADNSAQFQPIFEFSYMATAMPPEDWNRLYDGSMPYNSELMQQQLTNWASLYEAGCYNEDAFNHPNTPAAFAAGEAAMMLSSGSWDIPALTATMSDNLGVMVPPFADEPVSSIISTAGQGIIVTTYSDQKEAAGEFVAFVLSDAGQEVIANLTAPTRPGFPSRISQVNELIAMSTDPAMQNYPMFDNFTQPPVTDALVRNIALVLVGEMAPADALAAMDAAFAALPEEQKNVNIGLSSD
jgi:ABC-type glycerol-3-phosphate transport system substrate-binding protein